MLQQQQHQKSGTSYNKPQSREETPTSLLVTLVLFIASLITIITITLFAAFDCGASELDAKAALPGFGLLSPTAFKVLVTRHYQIEKVKSGDYHVYFSESIVGPENYIDLARGIRRLKTTDTLTLHLSNYGGDVHGGLLIVNALAATKATTKSIIESPSYSMAAVLACSTHQLKIEPYAYLMFHEYSGGAGGGKGSEVREFHKNFGRLSKEVLTNECVYRGVLTQGQVNDITLGVDVYIYSEDLKR